MFKLTQEEKDRIARNNIIGALVGTILHFAIVRRSKAYFKWADKMGPLKPLMVLPFLPTVVLNIISAVLVTIWQFWFIENRL